MASCARCGGSFDEAYMYKDATGQLVCRLCATPGELDLKERETKKNPKLDTAIYSIAIGSMIVCSVLMWCWFFLESGSDYRITKLTRPDMVNREPIPLAIVVLSSGIFAGIALTIWWRVWGMRIKDGTWVQAVVTKVYAFQITEDFRMVKLRYSVQGKEYEKVKTLPANVKEGDSVDVFADRDNPRRIKLFK